MSSSPSEDEAKSLLNKDKSEARFASQVPTHLKLAEEGILASTHKWQPETFRTTLELLVEAGVELAGLKRGIELLKQAEALPD